MMQLSFWKRLLCAALTLALGVTLAACSDDDTKDDKLIPEIEVTQSLTFDCTETQTKNLEIELNGKLNWQIKADAWIELSQTSGKGSATVAVTVPANATSRTGTITVTATGYMGATDTGTCSVRQIKEGETNTNVAELRRLIMATNPTANGKELTEEEIGNVVDQAAQEMDVQLSDEDRQEIVALMDKIKGLDIDVDSLKEQAKDLFEYIA